MTPNKSPLDEEIEQHAERVFKDIMKIRHSKEEIGERIRAYARHFARWGANQMYVRLNHKRHTGQFVGSIFTEWQEISEGKQGE